MSADYDVDDRARRWLRLALVSSAVGSVLLCAVWTTAAFNAGDAPALRWVLPYGFCAGVPVGGLIGAAFLLRAGRSRGARAMGQLVLGLYSAAVVAALITFAAVR